MEIIITKKEKIISLLILVVSIITIYLIDLYVVFSLKTELILSPLYIVNILFLFKLIIYSHFRRKRLKNFKLVLLRIKDKLMFILLYLLVAILLFFLLYQEISDRIEIEFLYAACLFTIAYLFNKPISISEKEIIINNHILILEEFQDCYDKNGKLIVLINNEEIIFKYLSNEEKIQVIEVFKRHKN